MRPRLAPVAPVRIALLAVTILPAMLGRRRARRPKVGGRELQAYRRTLTDLTTMIDLELTTLGDLVDALRRRDADPDEALIDLQARFDHVHVTSDCISVRTSSMVAPETITDILQPLTALEKLFDRAARR